VAPFRTLSLASFQESGLTQRPSEETRIHTRLLKCTLEMENSRAYWQRATAAAGPFRAHQAFEEYWFGARSLIRVEELISEFRARYDTFPSALRVLGSWTSMDPDTRRAICHWHLQLSDPLYRSFTGSYLVERHQQERSQVTRDLTVTWVGQQGPGRWAASTRIQLASKLLSSAYSVGLVTARHDPRPLGFPRIGDDAFTYLLYLLREVEFAGTILDNPYLVSVGLEGPLLEERLRALSALAFRRQGPLVDFGWRYADLTAWADATVSVDALRHAEGAV
jgi:hypothetical protein